MWTGKSFTSILESLQRGVCHRPGLVVITGREKVGKSILLDAYHNYIGEQAAGISYAFSASAELNEVELFNILASGLGLKGLFVNRTRFVMAFSAYLYEMEEGKILHLLVDDAHSLPQQILDILRLLSQIERDGQSLVQLVLVGARRLYPRLEEGRNTRLLRGLVFSKTLGAFSQQETADYIEYRLSLVGVSKDIFSINGLHLLHRATGGAVGSINLLCEELLMRDPVDAGTSYGIADLHMAIDRLGLSFDDGEANTKVVETDAPSSPSLSWEEKLKRAEAGLEKERISLQTENITSKAPQNVAKPPGIIKTNRRLGGGKISAWWAAPVVLAGVLAIVLIKPFGGEDSRQESSAISSISSQEDGTGHLHQEIVQKSALASMETPSKSNISDLSTQEKQQEDMDDGAQTVALPAQMDENVVETMVLPPSVANDSGPEPKTVPSMPTVEPAVVLEEIVPKVQEEVKADKVIAPKALPEQALSWAVTLKAGNDGLTENGGKALATFLQEVKKYPDAKLIVRGYVSSDTASQENDKLSLERAEKFSKTLIDKGLARERLRILGMGVQNPVASNSTPAGRSKNRRVELVILPESLTL